MLWTVWREHSSFPFEFISKRFTVAAWFFASPRCLNIAGGGEARDYLRNVAAMLGPDFFW
jgi:hypothetical protein